MAGLARLVPYIGGIIGTLPAVLLALLAPAHPLQQALVVFAVYQVVYTIEGYIIDPQVTSAAVSIPAAVLRTRGAPPQLQPTNSHVAAGGCQAEESAIAARRSQKGANQTVETNSPDRPSVQLRYPTDKLVAIIDAMRDAEQARHELLEAGFAPEAIGVQHGTRTAEHTVHSTDFDPFPHLTRLLHVHSIEHEHAIVYEQALRQGQRVIAVYTPKAETRERALGILEAHNAHYINFYGKWTIETLKP